MSEGRWGRGGDGLPHADHDDVRTRTGSSKYSSTGTLHNQMREDRLLTRDDWNEKFVKIAKCGFLLASMYSK